MGGQIDQIMIIIEINFKMCINTNRKWLLLKYISFSEQLIELEITTLVC